MMKPNRVIKNKEAFCEVIQLLVAGEIIDEFEHEGYRLSRNKKLVEGIIEGLRKKEGYCPCRVQKIPENICCCADFIENGHCCCGIWEKVEEE